MRIALYCLSIFLVFLLLCLIYLSFVSNSPEQMDEIVIGGIFALSGKTSETCKPYVAGIIDCVKQINEKGGINGRAIRLVKADSSYFIGKAINGYKRLSKENSLLAVFTWGTANSEALAPLVQRDEIPAISASFAPSLTNTSKAPYSFITGATYLDQFHWALKYIKSKANTTDRAQKIALVYSDTSFGRSAFFPTGIITASEMGIEIVDSIIIDIDSRENITHLEELKNMNADYLIVHDTAVSLAAILEKLNDMDLNIGVIGLTWTMDETIFRHTVPKARDGFVAVVTHPFWSKENRNGVNTIYDYGKKYGQSREMLNKNYILGYANMLILAHAIDQCKGALTGKKIKESLENMKGYTVPGLGFEVNFKKKVHHPGAGIYFYTIKENGIYPLAWNKSE